MVKTRLSGLQKRILKLVEREGAVSTQIVIQKLKAAPATASRNLTKLTELGYLGSFGKGPGTYYTVQLGTRLTELNQLQTELESYRPLPETIVQKIDVILVSRFIYATRTIEGAKLPLRETELVLSGISIRGNRDEIQDVKNQQKALELVQDFVAAKQELSEDFIKALQRQVTSNVVDVFLRGCYRDHEVGIGQSDKLFPSPEEVKKAMPNLVATVNTMLHKNQHPAVIAAYLHYKFLAIHPFQDGNGRTARLLMNAILLRGHYPVAVIEASQRYKYYEVLQKADEGSYEIFEAFIFAAIKRSLELYLALVRP